MSGRRVGWMPDSGNLRIAEFAVITGQVVGGYKIPLAFDQQFFAVVTIGMVAFVTGDISDIDVMDALLHGKFAIAGQGGNRGRGQTVEFVAWEKP